MIKITKIAEQVYVLKDSVDCYANLVIGKEKALLFDTCSGVDDLVEAVRTVTELPLLVIASHGHFDHIGGSFQFEKVYLSELDFPILESYNNELLNEWVWKMTLDVEKDFIDFEKDKWSQIQKLDFKFFNLGELECFIIPLPGHTKGSIGILIPDFGLLLSGDALTPVMSLNFPNHLSKKVQYKMLKCVQKMEFDYYLTSHHTKKFSKALIGKMLDCIQHSYTKKHYEYQYPHPPYTDGWLYLDSMEDEPIGIIWAMVD